jgi:hypothetical protein
MRQIRARPALKQQTKSHERQEPLIHGMVACETPETPRPSADTARTPMNGDSASTAGFCPARAVTAVPTVTSAFTATPLDVTACSATPPGWSFATRRAPPGALAPLRLTMVRPVPVVSRAIRIGSSLAMSIPP